MNRRSCAGRWQCWPRRAAMKLSASPRPPRPTRRACSACRLDSDRRPPPIGSRQLVWTFAPVFLYKCTDAFLPRTRQGGRNEGSARGYPRGRRSHHRCRRPRRDHASRGGGSRRSAAGLRQLPFRYYLAVAAQFLETFDRQARPDSVRALTDFLVEVARREFMEPEVVRAEYELILYAAQDEALAREFAAYERGLEVQLAARLERLGATRPIDASRTLIDLVRGFELERFTRPDAEFADLRRRLLPVVAALTGEGALRAPGERAALRRVPASPANHRLTSHKRRTR